MLMWKMSAFGRSLFWIALESLSNMLSLSYRNNINLGSYIIMKWQEENSMTITVEMQIM